MKVATITLGKSVNSLYVQSKMLSCLSKGLILFNKFTIASCVAIFDLKKFVRNFIIEV